MSDIIHIPNINQIIVITDLLHAAKRIFNSLIYPYQLQSLLILKKLRNFFIKDQNNSIEFWNCPSYKNWTLHNLVDKKTKSFNFLPCSFASLHRTSIKKYECDKILDNQKMIFQASNTKEQQFLELLNDDLNPIEPSYAKGELWLKIFDYSNLLCIRASRVIVNYAPIREYYLRFFPREEFKCPCSLYSIELRRQILHKCTRYNNYQNLRRNILSYFTLFLEFNSSAFSFGESITYLSCANFYFPYCLYLPVCSYEVTITVCFCTPHNKLLIFFKKKVYHNTQYTNKNHKC